MIRLILFASILRHSHSSFGYSRFLVLTQPMFGPVLTPASTSLLAKRSGPIVNKEIPMIVTSKLICLTSEEIVFIHTLLYDNVSTRALWLIPNYIRTFWFILPLLPNICLAMWGKQRLDWEYILCPPITSQRQFLLSALPSQAPTQSLHSLKIRYSTDCFYAANSSLLALLSSSWQMIEWSCIDKISCGQYPYSYLLLITQYSFAMPR